MNGHSPARKEPSTTPPPLTSRPPLVAITSSLPLGGSSTFLLNLARALDHRGLRLPIVVPSEQVELHEDFSRASAEILTLHKAKHIYEDRIAWSYEQVAALRPRAVLANLNPESFEVLRLVPPGVPRLGMIHSDDPEPYKLLPAFAPWLDAMVGVSSEICQKLRSMPESATVRIEHIPYGIDFPPPSARHQRSASETFRVVYVGRLVEFQKRVSRIASLVRTLERRRANVHFTIVGGGPDEKPLRESLRGCPLVEFRGAIPNHEIAPLLRQQDVYILLSDFEGLPLSLLEAMAEGVVPVVSDLPSGIGEVVTLETGRRVPVGDIEAAAAAIQDLAANPYRLSELSARSASLAREHYSADRMADRFFTLINQLSPAGIEPLWPKKVQVSAPQMQARPWLFRGWPRALRRFLKRLTRSGTISRP